MSAADNRAARRPELTKCERRIRDFQKRLFAVATREGRHFIWPSIDTIADACGCSRSTVKRAKAKFAALGLFTFAQRFRVHAGRAWRLPDVIYQNAIEAIMRPVPKVTTAARPTRRQRFTTYIESSLRQLTLALTPTPTPSQDRFIFEPASTVSIQQEERAELINRSKSELALAAFRQRQLDRQKRPV